LKIIIAVLVGAMASAGVALAASGEVSGRGIGFDQASACDQARTDARASAQLDAMRLGGSGPVRVNSYSVCQCEQLPTSQQNNSNRWQCTVRANYSN
jgi:hypothetical protein